MATVMIHDPSKVEIQIRFSERREYPPSFFVASSASNSYVSCTSCWALPKPKASYFLLQIIATPGNMTPTATVQPVCLNRENVWVASLHVWPESLKIASAAPAWKMYREPQCLFAACKCHVVCRWFLNINEADTNNCVLELKVCLSESNVLPCSRNIISSLKFPLESARLSIAHFTLQTRVKSALALYEWEQSDLVQSCVHIRNLTSVWGLLESVRANLDGF